MHVCLLKSINILQFPFLQILNKFWKSSLFITLIKVAFFQTSFFSCEKKIRVYINRTNDFGIVPVQEKSFNERVYYWWQVAKLFQDLRKSSNKKIVTEINTSIQHSIWERHYFIYTSSLAMLSSVRMLPQRHPWARNLIIFKSRISHSHNVSSNPQGLTLQHMYITCPCSYAFDLHTPAIVELFNV